MYHNFTLVPYTLLFPSGASQPRHSRQQKYFLHGHMNNEIPLGGGGAGSISSEALCFPLKYFSPKILSQDSRKISTTIKICRFCLSEKKICRFCPSEKTSAGKSQADLRPSITGHEYSPPQRLVL